MIFVGVIPSEFVSFLLRNADYKCLQLFCCLKLIYLANSLISLLFPHFTWFCSLSCLSIARLCYMKVKPGWFTQEMCFTAQTVQFKLLQFIWEGVHSPVPVTLLPFSDLPYLIDWFVLGGVGSALMYPWMLTQLWEQLHGTSLIAGFLGHLLPACLDLEKDICPLSEHPCKRSYADYWWLLG